MKKIIACAVVVAATLSTSQAAVFNGASVGLSAGTLTSKYTAKTSVLGFHAKKSVNNTFGTYGIHFDYDRSHANTFYWGMGLDFMLYSGSKSKNIVDADGDVAKLTTKYSWSSELDARFGYNFCNNAIVYGLAGLRLYDKNIKLIDTFDGEVVYKKHKTKVAPVIGAGFKAKVTNNISAGIEYRYAFEREDKYSVNNIAHLKVTQDSHAVLAKVSYHF